MLCKWSQVLSAHLDHFRWRFNTSSKWDLKALEPGDLTKISEGPFTSEYLLACPDKLKNEGDKLLFNHYRLSQGYK